MFFGLVFGVFCGLLVGHRWLLYLTKCWGDTKLDCARHTDILKCSASLPSLSFSPVPCVTDETLLTDCSSPTFLFTGRNRFTASPRSIFLTLAVLKFETCRIAWNIRCSRPHRRHRSIVLSQTRDLRKQIKYTR